MSFDSIKLVVSDKVCLGVELKQYRFPKQKSYRRRKKWAKNQNNYRMEEVDRVIRMDGILYVSSKTFNHFKNQHHEFFTRPIKQSH